MIELNVEQGRLSTRFNHFNEYSLKKIEATDTRLMGVVAMRLEWHSKHDSKSRFYQLIHLDYSEYGIDDYFEYECPVGEDASNEDKLNELEYRWKHFVHVMGGKIVQLKAEQAIALIDEAIAVWQASCMLYDGEDDNQPFREGAGLRVNLMKQALGELPTADDTVKCVSPASLGNCETINYFLMRLIDLDYHAAEYLSTISIDELKQSPLVKPGLQSLISNELHSDGASGKCYSCKFVTLSEDCYYLGLASIQLDGRALSKNRKVCSLRVEYFHKLSTWESAMLVKRSEYITVYDVPDKVLGRWDYTKIPLLANSEPELVGNGWQFTIYNSNNAHVDSYNYRMNDDIIGAALLSIPGEFIVMSYGLMNITLLENSIALSEFGPQISLTGRYRVDDMVFRSVCESTGAMFKDMIRGLDEYN